MNTDPIADLLTRIRNGILAGKKTIVAPASNLKREVLKLLVEHGFIKKFVIVEDGKQGVIKIMLKYRGTVSAIQGIQRVSKPGLRKYAGWESIPKVLNGLGMSIISTSKGVVTDRVARDLKTGGEILCKVW